MMPATRMQAIDMLKDWVDDEYQLQHALAVEGVMRYCAEKLGEPNVKKWGLVGLLHDLDYHEFPDQHCIKVQEIMREAGYDEDFIHAVASHGYGMCCDVKPEHIMEKVLYACDELTGLIVAAAIMRPSKSVLDLEVKSLKKKFKDKSFAAKIDREVIKNGAKMLGWTLDELMENTIMGMREVAYEIGLGHQDEEDDE